MTLKLDNISLRIRDFTLTADFIVPMGQIVAVLGPSGGGKSTLIALIAGFLRSDVGRIYWDGSELTDLGPGGRPISVLFQDNNLFPHLTLTQNVALAIRTSGRLTQAEQKLIEAALDQVGLTGLGARKPGNLSGGQQSRAALARIMVSRKPLVLLDEPFAALGPGLRNEMLDLTRALAVAYGQTVLMVTHDPSDALRIADSVIAVEGGTVHKSVTTTDFIAAPSHSMKIYLGI